MLLVDDPCLFLSHDRSPFVRISVVTFVTACPSGSGNDQGVGKRVQTEPVSAIQDDPLTRQPCPDFFCLNRFFYRSRCIPQDYNPPLGAGLLPAEWLSAKSPPPPASSVFHVSWKAGTVLLSGPLGSSVNTSSSPFLRTQLSRRLLCAVSGVLCF